MKTKHITTPTLYRSILFWVAAASATIVQAVSVTVDINETRQRIDGFGGSSAWYADEMMDFTEESRDGFLEFLFNPETGIGLTIHRPRINPDAGNFNGDPIYDWNYTKMSANDSARLQKQVALLQLMQERYDTTVLSSPWTPPAWMKSNSNKRGGRLKTENYPDYALYLAEYIEGMQREHGVDIDILSIQNEPDEAKPWDSCVWTAAEFITFLVDHLAPLFAEKGIAVPIMLNENTRWDASSLNPILNHPEAGPLVDYAAAHLYKRTHDDPMRFSVAADKGLPVWMTEFYYGNYLFSAGEAIDEHDRALRLARIMHETLTISEANAYLFWWLMAPSDKKEEGLIIANHLFTSSEPRPLTSWSATPRAYGMGQFSKFIRPGFHRLQLDDGEPLNGLMVSAYRDPSANQVVVVVINETETDQELDLAFAGFSTGSMDMYRTSATESLELVETVEANESGNISATIKARSITTLTSPRIWAYQDWRIREQLPATAPLDVDTDGDLIPDRVEFHIGTDPMVPTDLFAHASINPTSTGITVQIPYMRRAESADFEVRFSTDLDVWQTASETQGEELEAKQGMLEFSIPSGEPSFFQLRTHGGQSNVE